MILFTFFMATPSSKVTRKCNSTTYPKAKLRGGPVSEQDFYLIVFFTLVGCCGVNSNYSQGWNTVLNFIKKLGHTCLVHEMLLVNLCLFGGEGPEGQMFK